jgi:hypothetical protein
MTIYHINLFQEILPAIQVLRPANGATNVPVDGTQRVIPIPGSLWYTVEFSTAPDFSEGVLTSTSTSPGNMPKVDLEYNTKYYARAKSSLWPYYGKATSFTTESMETLAFSVHPNPSASAFNVSIASNVSESAQVVMTKLTGEVVENHIIQAGEVRQLGDNVEKGIYILKIITAEGVQVKRLVKE